MERKKDTTLFLFLAMLYVCTTQENDCSRYPVKNLLCYNNNYNTITCEWNSTQQSDTVCRIYAKKIRKNNRDIWSLENCLKKKCCERSCSWGPATLKTWISAFLDNKNVWGFFSPTKDNDPCELKSVDVSRPALKKCSMSFKKKMFQTFTKFSIDLICDPAKQIFTNITYKSSCHIKLDPPQKPDINFTTVSWISRESSDRFHLHWKYEDQSWTEASEQRTQNHKKECPDRCSYKLDQDLLIPDKRYEVRVRIKRVDDQFYRSVWSDWSPSASWVSPSRPTNPPSDGSGVIISIVACSVVAALLLAVIYLKRNKTIWIYMVTKIKGQPIPNPEKSFLKDKHFQNHLSTHLPIFFNPLKIATLEITSPVNVVAHCRPEVELPEKRSSKSSNELSSSNFSNPSYAHLCPPSAPSASLLTTGNLEPCAADTPYGPVCSKNEVKDTEREKVKKVAILELLSKGSNEKGLVPVMSDYEKIEKLQVERSRLQSLDSGVCSSEEVSQESLEADSINVTENNDGQVQRETGKAKEHIFQELFGGAGDIFRKGSIQVCSDYEPAQNLQLASPELQSLDLGVSEGDGQFSHGESFENAEKPTESTNLLFPLSSSILSCDSSITPLSLNSAGQALSPALQPLQCNILQRRALMSTSRSAEPSGDGYRPVGQEQS